MTLEKKTEQGNTSVRKPYKMHFNATPWLMYELHFKCNPLANITPTHKTKIFCMTWPQSDQKTKKEQPKSYLDQLPHGFVFFVFSFFWFI